MDINSLESRALRGMRSFIANEMKPLGKPLEQVYNSRRAFLNEKEFRLVEQMLNLGHSSLAAVFVQWQIRYTLVGTPEATEPGMPKKFLKDFLRPVQLGSSKLVLNGIPKELRDECGFKVDEVADRLKPTDRLRAVALLSHAVRESAAQEFRALIAYDSSLDDMPTSRDAVYIGRLDLFHSNPYYAIITIFSLSVCSCSHRDLSGSVGRAQLLFAMAIRKLAGVQCTGRNDRYEGAPGLLFGGVHFCTDLCRGATAVLLDCPTCRHSH